MASTRRKPGQLGPQVEGYRAWLADRGYTPQSVRNMLADLGRVGRWMSGEGLVPAQLDEDAMAAFAAAWLARERGLAAATVLRYENTARRFLQQQATAGGVLKPAGLTGADVSAFLLRECGRVSAGSAKGRVGELRAVLRFLYLRDLTPLRLGTAVPPVGGWRLAALPPTMTAADVQLLLDGCDRSTDVGVRDFAIMMLVARLGLRPVEVARLELRDVDWRAGELASGGRHAARTGSRFRPTSAGPWPATWPGAGCPRVPGGCSLPARHRAGRSARTWSATSSNGRAGGPACRGWDRTGCGLPTVTTEAALAWAQQAPKSPAGRVTTIGPRRMTAARGFARYLSGIDPGTEVPPPGLMPRPGPWRRPFIYTAADIGALLAAARQRIVSPLRAATYQTLIGLLAASGPRVGEAVKLDRGDAGWVQGVLLVRESKFGKSRLVPLHPSSMRVLEGYARLRDRLQPGPAEPAFFVSLNRTRLLYPVVQLTFRQLIDNVGIGAGAPSPPRLHDLRHTFAVRTLLGWYRAGGDVQAKIPSLSTYLGHREPASTYWYYLSAASELLALAAARQDTAWQAARS